MISVIIPVYKGERTLDRCLNSLENQSLKRETYEIIPVIDEGGYTKEIKEILNSHNLQPVLASQRLYFGGIRNLGIKNSKGNIIAFIDQDCYASKNWLEIIVNDFRNNPIEMVYGKRISLFEKKRFKRFKELEYIIRGGKAHEKKKRIFNIKNWKDAYLVSGQNMAFKKEVFDKYGFFDETYGPYGSEDLIFQFNLIFKNANVMFDPEMLVVHDHPLNFAEWLKKSYYYGVGNEMVRKRRKILLQNKWIKLYFPEIYPQFTSPRKISSKIKYKLSALDFFEIFLVESTDYLCKILARLKKVK